MNQQERMLRIEEYGRGSQVLAAALSRIPREAWGFKPAPAEWSVREVIFHMVDSEMIGIVRLNMLVAEPGSTLMSYDDKKWGAALSTPERDSDQALELFRLMRQMTYGMLKALPERVFANAVIHPDNPHPEYGDVYDVDKWLNIYAWHAGDHVEQLAKIHKAWSDQKR